MIDPQDITGLVLAEALLLCFGQRWMRDVRPAAGEALAATPLANLKLKAGNVRVTGGALFNRY